MGMPGMMMPGMRPMGMPGFPGQMGAPMMGPNPNMIYANNFSGMIAKPDFQIKDEESKKEAIGEFIYPQVEKLSNGDLAPKITGMIVDLPLSDLLKKVNTLEGLKSQVEEGKKLIEEEDD
jgi:polyadenylate-binding protein